MNKRCTYRNIPVLVLDRPTVLLKDIHEQYIVLFKLRTGLAAMLYWTE